MGGGALVGGGNGKGIGGGGSGRMGGMGTPWAIAHSYPYLALFAPFSPFCLALSPSHPWMGWGGGYPIKGDG